jgi:hypothetical protein
MARQDEYRRFAAAALDLATRTGNQTDKSRLVSIAEAWLRLADRATQLSSCQFRGMTEHPKIRAAFGRMQPEAD